MSERPSRGNIAKVLNLILKELQEINNGIKRLNGQPVDDEFIYFTKERYNNDSNRLGK